MTKIKEDLKLLDYLKEKGYDLEKLKAMIEDSIEEHTEEEEVEEKEEPQEPEEGSEEEEVPTFTVDDVKEFISEEVKKVLKIKRKVPSKGKLVDKTEIEKKLKTKREIFAQETFEQLV